MKPKPLERGRCDAVCRKVFEHEVRHHRHDFLEHLAAFLNDELVWCVRGLRREPVQRPKIVANIVRIAGFEARADDFPGVITVREAGWLQHAGGSRVAKNETEEVILATNPTVEGEATATYLAQQLKRQGLRVTRIAMGIPVGSDIEYTDEVTMLKAMEGRRDL